MPWQIDDTRIQVVYRADRKEERVSADAVSCFESNIDFDLSSVNDLNLKDGENNASPSLGRSFFFSSLSLVHYQVDRIRMPRSFMVYLLRLMLRYSGRRDNYHLEIVIVGSFFFSCQLFDVTI